MDGSLIDLSRYRFETAQDDLETARILLTQKKYKASVNRSYYAIFHALRAATVLESFDSGKHSGIIAYFNRHFVKTGIFDKRLSKIIDSAFRIREKADYQDFFIVSHEKAEEQIILAEELLQALSPFLKEKWKT